MIRAENKAVGIGLVVRDNLIIQGVERQTAETLSIFAQNAAKQGMEWVLDHLWKDAQGDDLPQIDREVIVLDKDGKVSFGHRPNKKGYLGKSLLTNNVETFYPHTYGKGGWNIPNLKYWLDVEIPIIE